MNRAIELRNDLDDLMLSAGQVESLLQDVDLYALHDMLARLQLEIRDTRREMLLLDAAMLLSTAQAFGNFT